MLDGAGGAGANVIWELVYHITTPTLCQHQNVCMHDMNKGAAERTRRSQNPWVEEKKKELRVAVCREWDQNGNNQAKLFRWKRDKIYVAVVVVLIAKRKLTNF